MTLYFDHAVIAVPDLEIAVRDYQSLGFTVVRGGVHANRATHNALIVFGSATYLELLAPTGEPPVPGPQDFSALLWRDGLTGFALRADDLEAEAARIRSGGLNVGDVTRGARRRADGQFIEWKLALLDGSFSPFLIQDVTPRKWRIPADPAITAHPNQALGVRGVVIAAPVMSRAWHHYARLLGLSPAEAPPTGPARHGIALRETSSPVGDPSSTEGLYAVQLLFEAVPDRAFDPERAHGVRFEPLRL